MKTVVLIALLSLTPAAVSAAVIGPLDTFQDNTTDHWFSGGLGVGAVPANPPHVVAGGKNGPSDLFVVVTGIGGNGPGSRISVINTTQWVGNFLTGGLSVIAMDLINLGQTTLNIRLQVEDPMFGPPADLAVSTTPFVLAPGSGWQHATFSLSPSAFTAVDGSASAALSKVTALRIINSAAADEATPVVGVLGIDNIQAIPEPATFVLLAAGLGVLAMKRRLHS